MDGVELSTNGLLVRVSSQVEQQESWHGKAFRRPNRDGKGAVRRGQVLSCPPALHCPLVGRAGTESSAGAENPPGVSFAFHANATEMGWNGNGGGVCRVDRR